MRGAGGRLEAHRNVLPASLRLGGVALRRRGISPVPSLSVIAGTGLAGDGADPREGLLGGDLLSLFDLDLDLPRRQLTLFSVSDCAGRFIPWPPPYEAVPVRLGMRSRAVPLLAVRLDGHPLVAVLDTGASASFLNLRGMRQLGLTPKVLANDPAVATGAIGGTAVSRRHRFTSLQIGAVTVNAPTLLAAPVPTPVFDMLLGLDVWRSRHLWISYATAQVFFTRPDD